MLFVYMSHTSTGKDFALSNTKTKTLTLKLSFILNKPKFILS